MKTMMPPYSGGLRQSLNPVLTLLPLPEKAVQPVNASQESQIPGTILIIELIGVREYLSLFRKLS